MFKGIQGLREKAYEGVLNINECVKIRNHRSKKYAQKPFCFSCISRTLFFRFTDQTPKFQAPGSTTRSQHRYLMKLYTYWFHLQVRICRPNRLQKSGKPFPTWSCCLPMGKYESEHSFAIFINMQKDTQVINFWLQLSICEHTFLFQLMQFMVKLMVIRLARKTLNRYLNS